MTPGYFTHVQVLCSDFSTVAHAERQVRSSAIMHVEDAVAVQFICDCVSGNGLNVPSVSGNTVSRTSCPSYVGSRSLPKIPEVSAVSEI